MRTFSILYLLSILVWFVGCETETVNPKDSDTANSLDASKEPPEKNGAGDTDRLSMLTVEERNNHIRRVRMFVQEIREFHDHYDLFAEGHFPHRSEMEDWLSSHNSFSESPELLQEVEDRFVILWDTLPENMESFRESGEKLNESLVAYEMGAEKKGGMAVFLDESSQNLSADELLPFYVAARERGLLKRAKLKAIEKTQDTANDGYDPVKAIKSLGGGIDITSTFKYVQLGSSRNENISDKDLVHLSHFPDLKMLDLYGAKITDDGLQHLAKLVNLENLDLRSTQINGPGLKHLSKMKYLKTLYLADTAIGDENLVNLKDQKSLVRLDLDSTQVTGPGLKHLSELIRLEILTINFTGLSDEAIEPLSKMKNLKFLTALDAKVSKEGLERLQKALPNCQIVFID